MTEIKLLKRNGEASRLRGNNTLHPVFARILAARGVDSIEQIDYQLKNIIPPQRIKHLFDAAELLAQLIRQNRRLLIFGDYDADGATSTAVCMRALTLMGYGNVNYLMPDRIADGYGLSPAIAQRIIQQPPDCVITVDNGISSNEGIRLLRDHDIHVIVTDHHLAGDALPNASVIVNQNAWADATEGKNLAGVGVAFYLMLALRNQLRDSRWFGAQRPEPNLGACLDLVALGSVADLVALDYCNRILVNEGLKRIRAGVCCEGIKALVKIADRQLDNFSSSDIAFTLAPRINAAGRLDDMTVGVQCLLAESEEHALRLAEALNDINLYRREIQQQMADEAVQQLDRIDPARLGARKTIVLYQADWHEGVVGIVASKLKEKYSKPCVVFARSEDGQFKGSGRSIKGIHLRDMLDIVDKRLPGAILKFGGHAMAAGLTLDSNSLQEFDETFESTIIELSDPACFDNIIEHDGELEHQHLQLQFATELQNLSPWGQRFPTPSFVGEFNVISQRVLKQKHLKLTLQLDNQDYVDAIAFFQSAEILNRQHDHIRIHYELAVNRFRDMESVQLMIRHIL